MILIAYWYRPGPPYSTEDPEAPGIYAYKSRITPPMRGCP
jgi:hypothetical protein